jgi:hypothetical protein
MSEIFRDSRDGFELIGLRNECVELAVVPTLGGKIVSLMDRRAGREWMWHPGDNLKLFANLIGDPFYRSTMTGADECLPSVAACEIRSPQFDSAHPRLKRQGHREIPDHGEVWGMPWQINEGSMEQGEVGLSVSLPISPLDFSRDILLNKNIVELRYRLRNRSDEPQHYLWAFHPLLRMEDGDRIELPAGINDLFVETTSWPNIQRGDRWRWPRPLTEIDLSRMDLGPSPAYAKCFIDTVSAGRFSIVNANRVERITFAFDSPGITTVGLWLTRGGWNGYHHVAIEPTNAAADSLEQAICENLCQAIPAGGCVEWSFRISVG